MEGILSGDGYALDDGEDVLQVLRPVVLEDADDGLEEGSDVLSSDCH